MQNGTIVGELVWVILIDWKTIKPLCSGIITTFYGFYHELEFVTSQI